MISDRNKALGGIIPAFYACYDSHGEISTSGVQELTQHLIKKGIDGVYVCGSSGECIYQNVSERKLVLENVVKAAGGKITIIAHVACNNTRDSIELAKHAEGLGVDAIAAIPPIYFRLPEYAIAEYWNSISAAAPNTNFMIYNIPQLAGTALTVNLFQEMRKNSRVRALKNSSMPVQDIQLFKDAGGKDFPVFNGSDEQFIGGIAMGADGGIGGTYAIMPELFLKMWEVLRDGDMLAAQEIQFEVNKIIATLINCHGNLYAAMKEVLKIRVGLELGSVRPPLTPLTQEDLVQVKRCAEMIDGAIKRYCPE